ncbi:dynamin-like protein, putative [Eimeria maxima]|uniref:Dynamin-like protein, putative n=1 Tax=Eimeria maxima TaxID=5804 RepID=U6MA45_EIMMA|nr:dynamin-like protein, putative [Eimeria maxima]CDJ61057.1 dynamin-like protein, putative [Eimeria maxima]
MEQLIPIMNRLQDALLTLGSGEGTAFDLPQIAVLQHTSGTAEWGEFSHSPGHRFTDFAQIRKEIERETERVTGRSKNISPIPICLKIFSPNVIDLTLVDLPGITKVPVGDQPSDIELQIRKIVLQYISQPSCVILAITAANTDIANSDSLKIAREADPEGIRTIGVVTKVDTMEEGCDCADILLGKVYPLRRGFVGVVCRSLAQTREQLSPRAAQEEESKFFQSHPAYKSLGNRCGTRYLARMLNQESPPFPIPVLMQHIRESLPELRERLQKRLQEAEAELAGYGDPLLEAKGNAGALLLHFFSKFARNFQDAIDGKLQSQHSSDHLMGGARINFIFHDWYGRALAEFDPLSGLTDHEIRTAIRNATGPKAALFVPESAFEILVKKQIQQLETPSLLCVEQVYDELQKIVEKSELPEMSRFTNLRDRILEVVCGVLKRCLAPTNQMIHNIIQVWDRVWLVSPKGYGCVVELRNVIYGYFLQIELAYINTNHPDFMSNKALPGLFGESNSSRRDSYSPGLGSCLQPPLPPQQQQSGRPPAPSEKELPPSPRGEFVFLFAFGTRGSCLWSRHSFRALEVYYIKVAFSVFLRTPDLLHMQAETIHQLLCFRQHRNLNCSNSTLSHHRLNGLRMPIQLRGAPESGGTGIRMPAVPPVVAPSDVPSDREQIETELIKSLLWSYFQIVRKNVADAVPKAIMYFMVNTAKDVLQRELVAQLYREELFGELMKEAGDISAKRQQCKQLLKSIRSALEIISQVRELGAEDTALPARRHL